MGHRLLIGVTCALAIASVTGTSAASADQTLAAGPPSIAVTPSSGLLDGQVLQVTGSGFTPGDSVGVAECRAGATSESDCFLSDVAEISVEGDGTFATSFHAARVIRVGTPGGGQGPLLDCAQSRACVLGAQDLTTLAGATVPIAFDPTVPPPAPLTVAATFSTGPIDIQAGGSIALAGTVSCSQSATVTITVQVTQDPAEGTATVGPINCSGTPSPFTTTVSLVRGVPLAPGSAQLSALVSAQTSSPSATGTSTKSVTETLSLQGSPGAPSARYYLALGDSLATGFAAPAGQGYADDLVAHYRAEVPGLQLVDLAVSGATTTSLIDDGQLQSAESFLSAHRGQVAFVTIDIGGNDIVGCGSLSGAAATTCVNGALATIATNLATILAGLRQAGGTNLAIYGMNYFDPFLIDWLTGPAGQAAARTSVSSLLQLNAKLQSIYSHDGAPTADVAGAFDSTDFTDLVPSAWGTIPRNVFLVCSWLDVTCKAGGPEGFGDDANAAGYRAIAGAFELVIDLAPTPTSAPSPSGPSETLAYTGFDLLPMVALGLGSTLFGLVALLSARRRGTRRAARRPTPS